MANTSQNHRNFVNEPMVDKLVMTLPGIDPALVKELQRKDIYKAYNVLGAYLVRDRDPERFGQWLEDNSGANTNQIRTCTRALEEWTDNHL